MAITKTSTEIEIDQWVEVAATEIRIGSAHDISGSYDSLLYIEVHNMDAAALANDGVEVFVEVSYGTENWIELTSFVWTDDNADATTLDGNVSATDTTITTAGAAWAVGDIGFIWDGFTGTASESFMVKSVDSGVILTLTSPLMHDHPTGSTVTHNNKGKGRYAIPLPLTASQVRVLYHNTDADEEVATCARISKVTAV